MGCTPVCPFLNGYPIPGEGGGYLLTATLSQERVVGIC